MSSRNLGVDRSIVDPPEGMTTETTHRILADPERRHLLRKLRELDTQERLSALVRNIAADERHRGATELHRLRIRLHHVHIPVLESYGLVEYYRGRRMVELTDSGAELAAQLPL